MFQIGFGFGPVAAGAMLTAVFAGNLAMKGMTTAVLRRFDFRPVLVVNGILNAVLIGACAFFSLSLPLALMAAILFLGGMSRSMQFTALNTIAFADVPPERMNGANTLFSSVFQLAMGLGVAWAQRLAHRPGRAGDAADPAMPFRIAFLLVATLALVGVWDSARLIPTAGHQVARRA